MRNSLVANFDGYEICCTATTLVIKKGDKIIKLIKSPDVEIVQEERLAFIESLQKSKNELLASAKSV